MNILLTHFIRILLLLSISTSTLANEQADKTNQKLTKIQQEINKQKQQLANTNVKREALLKQLKTDELAISDIAKAINTTKQQLINTEAKLEQLTQRQQQLQKQKKQQEQILAKQLRAAYSAGHHDYLKLLLNQENPAKVQRTISQYQYLNTARIKQIEQFNTTITELTLIATQLQQQSQRLQQLTKQQQQQQQVLTLSKSKREQTLLALKKKLLSSEQKIAKLEAEEQALVQLLKQIAELARKAEKQQGLSKLKRKLNWPVKGRILRSFGSSKQGYLKWKGVLLSASVGQQVKSIYSGTILFSDWLKGYGLVTVVDHGDGYMSLYGHNQALLKNVGDRIEAGEPIALAGQSGGQSRAGVYLEIRHDGKAMNPKLWCR